MAPGNPLGYLDNRSTRALHASVWQHLRASIENPNILMPVLTVLILLAASFGGGAIVLRLIPNWGNRCFLEHAMLSVSIGVGLVGWILFWLGIAELLTPTLIWLTLLTLISGNYLFFQQGILGNIGHSNSQKQRSQGSASNIVIWLLIAIALLAIGFDIAEALAPPLDADSLAYHFVLPRQFIEEQAVKFVPVAFSGAVPLLIHMTYAAALGLGGESALTGWTFISGWLPSIFLFAVLRRWLNVYWALAVALVFQTLPATIFTAGSGQVEGRLILFALIAFVGIIELDRVAPNAAVLIAGIGAGFYAASKFTGLFLIIAIGVTIFLQTRTFKPILYFLVASIFAGGQWYIWNFIHTGDPIFPFLFSISDWLGIANPNYWNLAHAIDLNSWVELRRNNAGISHLWLTYPLAITFVPPPEVQAGRIGLGPIFFFILPTAIYGIWKSRTRLTKSRLLPVAIIVILFYTLLMTFGSLPKVRHLLPFVPAILLCLVVTSISCSLPSVRNVLAGGFAIALILNLFAHFMFSRPYLIYHFQGKDREQFLSDNLLAYAGVKEVNRHSDITRLYIWDRHLSYYINPPTFFAAPFDQILIDSRIGHVVPVKFFHQLKKQKISHLLLRSSGRSLPKSVVSAAVELSKADCLELINRIDYQRFSSRTLKINSGPHQSLDLWKLMPKCSVSRIEN